jgi:transcriptional antiterminator RfaH
VRLTPLFPGYIFVSFDPDNAPWRSINGTLGVRRLLGSDARPQPTPPDLVPTLAGRCQNGLLEVHPFSAGDAVRILSGPFADRIAVIEGMHAADRVRVLLEIMGTFARVDLAPTDLAVE